MLTLKYIRELYESEKNSKEIQPLREELLDEIKSFLDKRRKSIKITDLKSFKYAKEVENASTLLKMLFELRERKIIDLLIKNTRYESSQKLDNLLSFEIEFAKTLETLLRRNKENIDALLSVKQELFVGEKEGTTKIIEDKKEEGNEDKVRNDKIRVRIIDNVPSFLHKNKEFLGPFQKGEELILDKDIGELLIALKKAHLL